MCLTFTLQVSEVEKGGIDTTTFSIVEEKVLFFWEWLWMDNDQLQSSDSDDDCERTDVTVIPETPLQVSSNESEVEQEDESEVELEDATCSTEIVHTVTFKCIGSTKDAKHQQTLEHINELHFNGTSLNVA